jgi:hypothetical protein
MFSLSTRNLIFSFALLTLCVPLVAQTIYKTSDGKTPEYSDRPPSSGKAETITVDPNQNVISTDKSPETQMLEEQHRQEDNARYQQEADTRRSRQERVAEAEADLRDAEEALRQAQEVQPGDFLSRKGGGRRPSLQRTDRINGLMDAVEDAKEHLEAEKYSREP